MVFLLNIILTFLVGYLLEIFVFDLSACEKTSKNFNNISQGYFTNNIPAYDFVYPLKVLNGGKELSHMVTHYYVDDFLQRRKKREFRKEQLRYDLPLSNGKTLKLVLTPNYDIATPSLIVEHKSIESEFNVGKTRIKRASRKRCYYKGTILKDPNSYVAISTCKGLAGFIRSSEGEYYIEPASNYNPIDGVHPHIVFKKLQHDINRVNPDSLFCGNRAESNDVNIGNKDVEREGEINDNDVEDEKLQNENIHSNNVDDKVFEISGNYGFYDSNFQNNYDRIKHNDYNEEQNSNEEWSSKESKSLLKNAEVNKRLKSKQKYDDNLRMNEDDKESSGFPEEQYLDVNKYNGNNNSFDKNDILKNDKFYITVRSSDSDLDTSYDNNDNDTTDDFKYDYDKEVIDDSSNHKNKFIVTDSNEENLNNLNEETNNIKQYCTKIYKESNGDVLKNYKNVNLSGMKKSFDDNKISLPLSSTKEIYERYKDRKVKVISLKSNNITSRLFNKIDKISKDILNEIKLTEDKKLLFSENIRKNKNPIHKKRSPAFVNQSGSNFVEQGDDFMNNDEKNCNYFSHGRHFSYNNQRLSHVRDSADENLDMKTNLRRNIEYQSCKLPLECRNKTECTWDVRLLMVVSHLFSQRHKDIDLETFILTIVNIVNRNFKDSSLGVLVNIKLVRMVFIEYRMEELDEDKNKIDDLFENFCLFQYRINPMKHDHPNHHDIAVYVTSTNLCDANLMYGLSNHASICNCQKSCIVSIDEGLLLGNIITHQIGHSLGANHNIKGAEQYCDAIGRKIYFHMDPSISLNATMWSKCSSTAIRFFIRTQGSKCLKHISLELNFDWPMQMLPGRIYNPVQQCSLNFHLPLLPCYNGDFCKNLYCQINEKQCISNLVAPADGTPCATHMWCIRGHCVTEGRYPGMINGEWNTWGPWSACTRSCGGGVQQANRLCNNPTPTRGGRTCFGERTRYRICSTERCDPHAMGFREQQCRKTEEIPFRGLQYSWNAYYNNFEYVECSLLCESETGIIAVRRLVVDDGTACKPGTKNVCIAGKCVDIGCDWGINSGAVVDACGLCHGNGTECKIIQGLYNEKNNTGYIPFMKVPRGSGMIYTRELNPSDLTFVVSSFNTGNFYLNTFSDSSKKPRSGDVDFGSSRGLYSILGGMERIFIPGPTDEDLVFFVKFNKDTNPGIRYQFALPEVDPNYIPTYSWQFIDWDTCSAACGGGQQRARSKCVEDQGGIVENTYCSELVKPADIIRSCNEFPCLPKWWVGSWSGCIKVGKEEVRYRSVLCMRTRDPNSLRNEILKDKYCCNEEKPDVIRKCNESLTKCPEKEEPCGLNDDFPDIINLNELEVRFVDDEHIKKDEHINNESNQGEEKVDDFFNDLDEDVNESSNDDYTLAKLAENIENKLHPQKFGNVDEINIKNGDIQKVIENVIGRENISKLASLHNLAGKFSLRMHNDTSPYHNNNISQKNSSVKSPVSSKPVKFTKFETNLPNNHSNSRPPVQINSAVVRLTYSEIPTTCKAVFTCKSENKDICNITEPPVPHKCNTPSLPLKTVYDQIVLNEFRIAIIPISCEKHSYRPADHDYEVFHDSTIWAVGLENQKTVLYGKEALNFLVNVRKNMSRLPFIFQAEN